MKTAGFKIAESYLRLIREFPLRPIRNEKEYNAAAAVAEQLVLRDENTLDSGEQDYLDALAEFIVSYEQKHYDFGVDRRTPLERLKRLLEETGTTPSMLQKILACSQPLVSLILSGKRELTKDNIKVLANHFKFEPGYLL